MITYTTQLQIQPIPYKKIVNVSSNLIWHWSKYISPDVSQRSITRNKGKGVVNNGASLLSRGKKPHRDFLLQGQTERLTQRSALWISFQKYYKLLVFVPLVLSGSVKLWQGQDVKKE